MEIKYLNEIALLEDETKKICIGASYIERELIAYRWVFEDINDVRNFRPRALDPSHPEPDMIKKKCGGWSLSFFTSELSASNKLKRICNDKKNLYKKLGTHIAEGRILENDGKSGDFNSEGHFEHFEYVDTDFTKTFEIKIQIC